MISIVLHVRCGKTLRSAKKWLRYILKMPLAVSLRRALLVLLLCTVSIIMVLYWNQMGIQPQSFERSIRSRVEQLSMPNSIEKMWTYRCEGDRCLRHHYNDMDGQRRVPFVTCAMACGGCNVWPLPTGKTLLSLRSVKFCAEDVQLHVQTPFPAVRALYQDAFELFRKDLRRIQRLEAPVINDDEAASAPADANEAATGAEREPPHHTTHTQRRRHVDVGQLSGDGGVVGVGGERARQRLFDGRARRPPSDLDRVLVQVSVRSSPEVHLNLRTDEAYHLTISQDKRQLNVSITAETFFGARHALATLQQLVWYDDADQQLRVVSKASVRDMPKFRYRGLMLDTSRHYFSVDAIKRTIAGMSYAKLNRFHWHMTDSQSFPYVSKYYPELAAHGAYSDRETYTPDDVREVAAYAKLHGVQVVPEIDAPAHAGNGWDWGVKRGLGELALCINQQPWSFYCGEPPCGQLNPKNNNTYLILQRLYEELLNLTGPTDYFHLGGDEVNLDCWAQHFNDTDLRGLWCDFTHNALARLKLANGNVEPKIVSVWSSGLTNTKCLSRNKFTVQVWGGSTWQENYDLIDNGYNVIFSHVDAWYLDCGFGNWRATGEGACSPYRTWQNVYKHRPWERMRLDNTKRKQVLGGEVCLWTEQVDEGQLDNRLWPRSAALAERLWSDPSDEHDMDVLPQDVFRRMSLFRSRLVELGLRAEPVFPKYCAQNPGECI